MILRKMMKDCPKTDERNSNTIIQYKTKKINYKTQKASFLRSLFLLEEVTLIIRRTPNRILQHQNVVLMTWNSFFVIIV